MVREGVSAYRAGRKEEARALLLRAVEIDQYNEDAWLWLSAVVDTPEEQRTCLENVITINPNNERARQGIQILDQRLGAASKAVSSQAEDVLAAASFTPPPSPFTSDSEELPTSIEWGETPATSSSSPSANYRINEPSDQEYDDWVTQLNIGGGSNPGPSATSTSSQSPMMSSGILDDDDVADPDDLFSSGPFSSPEISIPEVNKGLASPKKETPSSSPLAIPSQKQAPLPKTDVLLDELDDDSETLMGRGLDEQDEDFESAEFFQYIPKEIASTRLPGTNERYPLLVVVALVVLVVINLGALLFFIQQLTTS
jgi:hypothetical protein